MDEELEQQVRIAQMVKWIATQLASAQVQPMEGAAVIEYMSQILQWVNPTAYSHGKVVATKMVDDFKSGRTAPTVKS